MPDILTVTLNPALDVSTSVARLAHTHKLRCATERRDPGGGGINVARVIQRLGGDVAAVFPSAGPIGAYLERLLSEEGVRSHAAPVAGVTRESFTVVETETGAEYRFVLPGPRLSTHDLQTVMDLIERAPLPRYIVASGSLPPDAPVDAYARIAAVAKARGAKFVLDASGPPLRAALNAGVHLMKPSLSELEELAGERYADDSAIVAFTRGLLEDGSAEAVAVSKGAAGALLITRGGAWSGGAIEAPVQSSVGAGDSFLAGMIWSLSRGRQPEESLRHALAAGAAALLRPGTELCLAEDVARFAPLAQVRRL